MRCWDSEPAERVAFAGLSGLTYGKILYLVMGLEAYGSFILILIRVTRQDLPIFVVIYTVRRAPAPPLMVWAAALGREQSRSHHHRAA